MKVSLYIIVILLFSCASRKNEICNAEYEPKNLDDALAYMVCSWSNEDIRLFKNKNEEIAVSEEHFKYGQWIKNHWVRNGNSKFGKFFIRHGIIHPDDISSVVLKSFHRKLNNKSIDLAGQIQYRNIYWQDIIDEENNRNRELFNAFKIGDTLNFGFLRTFVDDEQEQMVKSGRCKAKGVLLKKSAKDFYLKIKIVSTCDSKGINTIDFRKNKGFERNYVGDVVWNYFNDWQLKNN